MSAWSANLVTLSLVEASSSEYCLVVRPRPLPRLSAVVTLPSALLSAVILVVKLDEDEERHEISSTPRLSTPDLPILSKPKKKQKGFRRGRKVGLRSLVLALAFVLEAGDDWIRGKSPIVGFSFPLLLQLLIQPNQDIYPALSEVLSTRVQRFKQARFR